MLSVTGTRPGLDRRELLRVGALSLFSGMSLPGLLQGAEGRGVSSDARAKSVILFNLLGGPSHTDMFDMKPLAPPEVRGEFKPIATSLPGLEICEHLPLSARLMHQATLVRTVSHGYNAHNPLNIMTGFSGGKFDQIRAEPSDPPDIGAICQYLGMGPADMPGAVCMPCYPGWGESAAYPGIRRPGPYGGYLGSQYDPLFSVCNPTFSRKATKPYYDPVRPLGQPQVSSFDAQPGMTVDRSDRRRTMLEQLDSQFQQLNESPAMSRLDRFQQRAFSLLTSSRTRDAFDLSSETVATKDAYGQNLFGSSMLIARRLVEAGVPFVSVHAENFPTTGSYTYDMHENNFGMLRDENLPVLDLAYSGLVNDLESRGLLDSTMIIVMGEMGRSPRVNSLAGRDHWPQCGFSLLTGGGFRKGQVYGTTDKQGGYPTSKPVSPADIVATIYQLLGIDPHLMVPDRTGRPLAIAHGGSPIWDLIA